jgi:hypothetical protein
MNDIVIFETDSQQVQVQLRSQTLWVSQGQMADLFATSTDNISLHLKNIYKDNELNESATTEDFSVVREEGKRRVHRKVKHYNLDAIISVGYRVNSSQVIRRRITMRCTRKFSSKRKISRKQICISAKISVMHSTIWKFRIVEQTTPAPD